MNNGVIILAAINDKRVTVRADMVLNRLSRMVVQKELLNNIFYLNLKPEIITMD